MLFILSVYQTLIALRCIHFASNMDSIYIYYELKIIETNSSNDNVIK